MSNGTPTIPTATEQIIITIVVLTYDPALFIANTTIFNTNVPMHNIIPAKNNTKNL